MCDINISPPAPPPPAAFSVTTAAQLQEALSAQNAGVTLVITVTADISLASLVVRYEDCSGGEIPSWDCGFHGTGRSFGDWLLPAVNRTTVHIVGACSENAGGKCTIDAGDRGGIFDVAQSAGRLEASNLVLKSATKVRRCRLTLSNSY